MATAQQQQVPLGSRLALIAQQLETRFLGKEEVIRLLLIAIVTFASAWTKTIEASHCPPGQSRIKLGDI